MKNGLTDLVYTCGTDRRTEERKKRKNFEAESAFKEQTLKAG